MENYRSEVWGMISQRDRRSEIVINEASSEPGIRWSEKPVLGENTIHDSQHNVALVKKIEFVRPRTA